MIQIQKSEVYGSNVLSWFCIDSSDAGSSPAVRGGLFRGARDPQASGTCMSWGGTHYRTFDRKHFHFQGSCTYLLASSTDGTWAVYMSTECDPEGHCRKVQTHTRYEFIFTHTPVLYVYRSQRELKMDHVFFPDTSFWFYCASFVYPSNEFLMD